jgi:hypothetical protein
MCNHALLSEMAEAVNMLEEVSIDHYSFEVLEKVKAQ